MFLSYHWADTPIIEWTKLASTKSEWQLTSSYGNRLSLLTSRFNMLVGWD